MSDLARMDGRGGKNITMHYTTGSGTQVGEVHGKVQVIERLIVLPSCACGCTGRRRDRSLEPALACIYILTLASCWLLALLCLVGPHTPLIAGPALAFLAVLTLGAARLVCNDQSVEGYL